MPRSYIALRYMDGFECLGGACEDTCCGGWRVDIDESHYKKLKRQMERTPDEAERFRSGFAERPSAERTRYSFAVLRTRPDGFCTFLDEGGLCGLQRSYGERSLPDVCAAYPRTVSRAGQRMELTGALSCPEVARRALLDERATDLVEVMPGLLGRQTVTQEIDANVAHAYARHLDEVRGTLYELLAGGEYPIASRLFFAAWLADRISGFFNNKTPEIDEPRLARELAAVGDAGLRAELHEQLRAAQVASPVPLVIILKVLAERLTGKTSERFRKLVGDVLQRYADAGAGVKSSNDAAREMIASPEPLWAAWVAQRSARQALFGERFDLYLQNYCKSYVMRDWFIYSPSLQLHLQNLLVRVAILRFLLVGHPGLDAVAAVEDAAERTRGLDRLAVEVFYLFSRTLEHSDDFLTAITTALAERFATLQDALTLIKF
jgi:lysine-N-methylase